MYYDVKDMTLEEGKKYIASFSEYDVDFGKVVWHTPTMLDKKK